MAPNEHPVVTVNSPRRPNRIRRSAISAVWIGLCVGSISWLVCKISTVSYQNTVVTLLCWEPGVCLYWGGDSDWRSIHAAGLEPWPKTDEDSPFGFSGGSPMDGFNFDTDLYIRNIEEWDIGAVFNRYYWSIDRLGFGRPRARFKSNAGFVVLPLGWFPLGLVLFTGIRFKHRLQHRPDYPNCTKCRYNLTGNTSGRCPECGEPVNRVPSAREKKSSPSAKV